MRRRHKKKPLGDRWHECACGASCHRDENSARGLLNWGLAKWTGTDPCVEREALAG
ncbi:MAG: hypothetical protein AB7T14_08765 [Candidatus Methylacidiphilaceae bacterium]